MMRTHNILFLAACCLLSFISNAAANDFFFPKPGTYTYKGTEWNEAWEGQKWLNKDGEVEITAKVKVKKFADLPNGELVLLTIRPTYPAFVKGTEFESMATYALDLVITKDQIYELEENQLGQYIDNKEPPHVSKEGIRCQKQSLKEEKLLETTHRKIDVTPDKCDFYWWNDDGDFSTFKWTKGKGLVEISGGVGAHKSGSRLKLVERP